MSISFKLCLLPPLAFIDTDIYLLSEIYWKTEVFPVLGCKILKAFIGLAL